MPIGAGLLNGWNWFTDLHPKTKQQYDHQRFLGGLWGGYANWMKGRAQDEISSQTMADLGIDWSDIKSPWASNLAGGNSTSALGGIARGVSSNVTRLYSKEKRARGRRTARGDPSRAPRTARQDFHRLGPRYYRLGNEILAYYNPKRL